MLAALLQKIVEANDLLHDGTHPADAAAVAAAASGNGNGGNHSNNSSQANDGGLFNNKYSANVLAFHGRNIPAISLYAYLTRILKYCPVTNDVFLSLLVYFDRIAKRANNTERTNEDAIMGDTDAEAEAETNNNAEDDNGNGKPTPQIFVMDSYNIHRLIISGITVASKFFSDVFYKNSRYAKVGGLPLEELNHLELQFLLLLDFQLMIQVEELERYGDLLLRFWNREHKPGQGQGQGGQEQGQGQDPHGE
jgi:PHO85 cyclin-6/7